MVCHHHANFGLVSLPRLKLSCGTGGSEGGGGGEEEVDKTVSRILKSRVQSLIIESTDLDVWRLMSIGQP